MKDEGALSISLRSYIAPDHDQEQHTDVNSSLVPVLAVFAFEFTCTPVYACVYLSVHHCGWGTLCMSVFVLLHMLSACPSGSLCATAYVTAWGWGCVCFYCVPVVPACLCSCVLQCVYISLQPCGPLCMTVFAPQYTL